MAAVFVQACAAGMSSVRCADWVDGQPLNCVSTYHSTWPCAMTAWNCVSAERVPRTANGALSIEAQTS